MEKESKALSWNQQQVVYWLRVKAYHEVVETFTNNEINGATLLSLTPKDLLDELKIKSLEVRKALYHDIQTLKYAQENRDLESCSTLQREVITSIAEECGRKSR